MEGDNIARDRPTRRATRAVPAPECREHGDAIAHRDIGDAGTDVDNNTGNLVPEDLGEPRSCERVWSQAMGGGWTKVEVKVRAAESGKCVPNSHLSRPRCCVGNLVKPEIVLTVESQRPHAIDQPPSIASNCPVTSDAASEHNHTIASATSEG